MSITNLGNQYITFDYRHPAKGSDFNTLLREAVKAGVYSGGLITFAGTQITIAPFVIYIKTGTLYTDGKLVRIETRANTVITVNEATPVIALTYTWQDVSENWLDFNQRAHASSPLPDEICLGECIFGGGVITSIDYSEKTWGADNGIVPIGSIISRLPGYFTNGSNAGYSAIAIDLPSSWKVCDGSVCADADSPIFNGAGRYLPNLTDNRFLMGSTVALAGLIGGNANNQVSLSEANLPAHTHTITHTHTFSGSTGGHSVSHTHGVLKHYGNASNPGYVSGGETINTGAYDQTAGASADHTHTYSGTTAGSSAANSGSVGSGSVFSILPKYLTATYIIRIK
jgi:hypothetical protein